MKLRSLELRAPVTGGGATVGQGANQLCDLLFLIGGSPLAAEPLRAAGSLVMPAAGHQQPSVASLELPAASRPAKRDPDDGRQPRLARSPTRC